MANPALKVLSAVLATAIAAGIYFINKQQPASPPSPSSTPTAPSKPAPTNPAAPSKMPPPADTKPVGKVDPSTIRHGLREPLPKTKGAIRVTSYNIENLFDDKDDPKLSDDQNMTKPAAHMQAAAEAIRKLDCDILCLQETESLEAVKWFRDKYLGDMGYQHVASIDAGDPRGIEQTVLSRFPIKDSRIYLRKKLGGRQPDTWGDKPNNEAGRPFEFKRSPLQVTIEVPNTSVADLLKKSGKTEARASNYELTLFVCHLKSGREYDQQREAEASGVVDLIRQIEHDNPKANILALGDMNAIIVADSLKKFTEAGLPSIWQDRAPRDEKTMTHTTARCIDHVFYNKNIAPELVLPSRFVLGMPARPDRSNPNETPAPAGYASDHYPVSIDLVPVESK